MQIPKSIIYYIKKGKNLSFFKENNFTVKNLKNIGRYTATEFKRAGYTVKQLKNDFYPLELKDAGYTVSEMIEGDIDYMMLYFLNFDFVPTLEFIKNHFQLPIRQKSSTPEILRPKSNLLIYVFNSDVVLEAWEKYLPSISKIISIEILLEQEISIQNLITIFKTYEDINLILYFFRIKNIPLNLIFDAMSELFPSKDIDSIMDDLKFIYEVNDFVDSKIPQSIYQSKLSKRDLVKIGIDIRQYVEEVDRKFYPYHGDPIGDAERSANGFIPLQIKTYIYKHQSNLETLLKYYDMSNIKETLEFYFRVSYMTPFHPMYKGFKKIDDEVYKSENGF